jgi:hypothetical protein
MVWIMRHICLSIFGASTVVLDRLIRYRKTSGSGPSIIVDDAGEDNIFNASVP